MDFEFNNDFSLLPISLKLFDDVKEGVKRISRDMNELKASLYPVGMSYVTDVIIMMP